MDPRVQPMGMPIRNVGVLGAGQTATDIAQSFARTGLSVHLLDASGALSQAMSIIAENLGRLAEAGQISETDKWQALARIRVGRSYELLADCDLIIDTAAPDGAAAQRPRSLLRHCLKPTALVVCPSAQSS